MIVGYEGDTPALEDDAKGILSLLWNSYPGHPWYVRCMKGMVFIRHLDFPPSWGAALRVSEVDHDIAVFNKKIIMGAGELLERAAIARGRYDSDQEITRVEGIEDKRKPLDKSVVMEKSDERTQARPQVELAVTR